MRAFGLLAVLAFAGQPIVAHPGHPAVCKDGAVKAPRGPFAVWVFCEDALGTHIGVVYANHMAAPSDGAWGINNRFWQEGAWPSDVQTFAWSEDGARLFVSTGAVYGSSTLYQLDLSDRRVYELIASVPDHDVEILWVTSKSLRYRLRDIESGDTKDGEVLIRERRGK